MDGRRVACKKCGLDFIIRIEGRPNQTEVVRTPSQNKARGDEPAATVAASVTYEPAPTIAAPMDYDSSDQTAVIEEKGDWAVGDVLLELYEVTGFLGQGGMGRVYKVRHRHWNVDLAVKTPRTGMVASANWVEDFEKEAETWVNLGLHPQIVSCYYIRRIDGIPSVFAEYVSEGSLHDWLVPEEGKPAKLYRGSKEDINERILDLAIQIAWGLGYAHDRGLVHLDVKPGNVMISDFGSAKVTDFGLAMALAHGAGKSGDSGASSSQTNGAPLPGTPQYFSPEQAGGLSPTLHTDIWSWGLCILEMFKGGRTWESGTVAAEALEEYTSSGPADANLPLMPEELTELLKKCFRREPSERPASMDEIQDSLVKIYEKVFNRPYHRRKAPAGHATADSLNNRAVSLLDLGRLDEAERLWEKALAAQPHHVEATYNKGLILWRRAQATDTDLLGLLTEVGHSRRDRTRDLYYRALVHLERNDCGAALETVKDLKGDDGRDSEIGFIETTAANNFKTCNRLLKVYNSHEGAVNSVSMSAGGKYFLSGGDDQTVKLWELKSGKVVKEFQTPGETQVVCLSADGRTALAGGGDFASKNYGIKVWDVSGKKPPKTLAGHEGMVNAAAISPDGSLAVTAGDDKTVMVWDVSKGECLQLLTGHNGSIGAICLAPDGKSAYSGAMDQTIRAWNLESGDCSQVYKGHEGRVTSLCMSADGRYFLSAGTDRTLRLWEVSSYKPVMIMTGHSDEINAAVLSPDGLYAVSGGSDRTLKLWDVSTGRCLRTFEGHESWVLSICLSRDGRFALSGSLDKTVRLWKTEGGFKPFQAPMALSKVSSSEKAFTARDNYERLLAEAGRAISSGDTSKAVESVIAARLEQGFSRASKAMELWRRLYLNLPRETFSGGWEERAYTGDRRGAGCVVLNDYGTAALIGSEDGRIDLWDLTAEENRRIFKGHQADITALSFSKDGGYFVSGGKDHSVRVWDFNSGECRRVFDGHDSKVNDVVIAPDNKTVVSCDDDGMINIWDASTGAMTNSFKAHGTPVNSLSLSMDGRRVLSASGDYTPEENVLKLWNPGTGDCLRTFKGHERAINTACLSPNGLLAVSGGSDKTIRIWELESGKCITVINAHSGAVQSLSVSADSRFILSGAFDHSIGLWDINSGRLLRMFEGHTAPIVTVCMSRNVRYALSGSRDGSARLWALDWKIRPAPPGLWDERARPWLKAFLIVNNIAAADGNDILDPSHDFSEEDMKEIMFDLGCAGFGPIKPERVKLELEKMIAPAEESLEEGGVFEGLEAGDGNVEDEEARGGLIARLTRRFGKKGRSA